MVTRTQVAQVLATDLTQNRAAAVNKVAAWLVDSNRTRQASYLAKDVAWLLEQQGYVYAKVITAKALSESAKVAVTQYIRTETGASEVELDIIIDPSVVGGIRIETPSATFDDTVISRLNTLVREVE